MPVLYTVANETSELAITTKPYQMKDHSKSVAMPGDYLQLHRNPATDLRDFALVHVQQRFPRYAKSGA